MYKALDELRHIARFDSKVSLLIESWIGRYVREYMQDLTVDVTLANKEAEYLEYMNEMSMRQVVEAVVKEGSELKQIPSPFDWAKRYRRSICIIKETE